ncbi:O-antigen ligase [Breznakia blatticola]|uniref:O-antigen ligase n=1 Tax=Breznakia blatticola TaxID=1754012 RepID=A0A4V3G6A7_9FIRM|nr:O-antigen ligase family protein [Breznakia blatticola]TDW14534.1 O-antigen ligase [Breznakia blatticola]
MGHIRSFLYDFRHIYTLEDKLIVIMCASLFLPYVVTIATVIGIAIYVLVRKKMPVIMKSVKRANLLFMFAIYLFVVSLLFQNYLGALLSVGMGAIFINVVYFRKYIHRSLLEIVINVMIVLSIISVVYAIGENIYYMNNVDAMHGFFDIQNKPEHRVHTFFFNANYYAMMLVFSSTFCVHQFMFTRPTSRRIFYVIAGVINLFGIFLTGGRIAWLCLAIALLGMLLVAKWYKTFIVSIAGIGAALGLLALKPGLLPRIASQGLSIGRRLHIWQTASLMVKDTWIFGKGPLTYYHFYPNYYDAYVNKWGSSHLSKRLGISAPHTHSMFIEPFISFGLIGTIFIGGYILSQVKRYIRMIARRIDASTATLITGVLLSTIAFCIIDFPVFWVQTGTLFLLILGCSEMNKKELEA